LRQSVTTQQSSDMAMQAVLAVVSLLLLLWPARRAGAAEYVVGDVGYGWESGSGINYAAWAREYSFAVGDVLGRQLITLTAWRPPAHFKHVCAY